MVFRSTDRVTTVLCLLLALWTGLAPMKGTVLCFEPTGNVTLDVATPEGRCCGCGDVHPTGHHHDAPSVDHHARDCSCVDVSLSTDGSDRRVPPKPTRLDLDPLVIFVRAFVAMVEMGQGASVVIARHDSPRMSPVLDLIRSVVLVV